MMTNLALKTPYKFFLILCCFWIIGCTSDQKNQNLETIKVRLATEPDRLNPLLTNSTVAIMVNAYIFFPLADFDPLNLKLKPLLIKSIPKEEIVSDGPYKGDYKYTYDIRETATWSDGQPVTAEDYLFTVKAAFNPFTGAAGWRGYLGEIKEIKLDPDNPKVFSVIVENDYMLAKEITCTFPILPKHIYDTENVLNKYSLADLRSLDDKTVDHQDLIDYAEKFSSAKYSRDIVVGSGPYQLENWSTKQSIALKKVDNWWGNQFADISPDFMNEANQIEFAIIADEIVALTALKSGQIHVMSNVSPDQFTTLKNDQNYADKLSFKTPAIMRYYYVGMNTKSPILSDKRVRRALVHTLSTSDLIEDVAQGLAQPIVGPFNPSKSYYNHDLKILEKDIDRARELIGESGWKDTNNNGIVDKAINGKLEEMELDILVTQKPLGQKIALLLKENGKKIGIDINIIVKDFSLIRNDLKKGDFDMTPLVGGQAPTPNDPYQTWHTDNIANGGNNYSGFGTEQSDELIEKIRTTKDLKKRDQLYKELQEIIYDEQPFIFLYAPVERIIADKQLEFETSSKRPGFFVNTFKRAS